MANAAEKQFVSLAIEGDIKHVQEYAKTFLKYEAMKKDAEWAQAQMAKLDARETLKEIPSNVQGLLYVSNAEEFLIERYVVTEQAEQAAQKIIAAYRAAQKLTDMKIHYLPSLLLEGEPGTGKTELARYIAYRLGLPFVCIRLAAVVDSLLGATSRNISRLMDYVRTIECVVCFDELDFLGIKRGSGHDVQEMDRIVITLMQEIDRLPNSTVLLATTNRIDRIDAALRSRFSSSVNLGYITFEDARKYADTFFESVGSDLRWSDNWIEDQERLSYRAAAQACVQKLAERIAEEET